MKEIDNILNTILKISDPEKVILFGSRAVGKENDDSDYDFMIIKSNVNNERVISRKIYRELYKKKISKPVDIIVVDKEKFNNNKEKPYMVYFWADQEGRVLYG